MKEKEKLIGCPHCGSTRGFESRTVAYQHYKADGTPDGCDIEEKNVIMVTCLKCGRRVKLNRLANGH